jgi:RNA polymerase sigma factor (sigma-70 family)
MSTTATNSDCLVTYLPMLWGAQDYLKSLLQNTAPGSLVAEAWDDFYRVYDDLIRRFVVAQGIPRCDVDDCVQEVWAEVASRLITFNRPADRPGLRAWLYTVVRSKATNVYRKRTRQPQASLQEMISDGNEPGVTEADPAVLYEDQWEKAVLDTVFDQLREQLSPANARVMQMRLVEHRSVAEVAAELKMAPAIVHARQHRIMKKLQARVALYTGGPLGAEPA